MLKLQPWFVKSNIRTYTPPEQIKVEPNIAIVKDLLSDNMGASASVIPHTLYEEINVTIKLANRLLKLKKSLSLIMILLFLLLMLRNHLFLLGLRIMLKLQLLFVRVILELIHPVSKLKLNLVLLWLKISW